MRDLIELVNLIDQQLSEDERREKFCDLFLKELQTLKGRELAPYLSECVYDTSEPGIRIVLSFPIGAQVFNPSVSEFKCDRA